MTPTPSSDIEILSGVPLDNKTKYTLYFPKQDTTANRTAQLNTFRSFRKYILTANSYQRVDKGTLRIAKPYEDVYACNYMIFNNGGHENKYFFCYIDRCTYINEHTTEIHYELDVIQTWYFEYRIPACMIEREHSATDAIGQNIVPEDISVGDYYGQDYHFVPLDRDNTSTNRFALVIYYVPNEYYFTSNDSHTAITPVQADPGIDLNNRGFIAGDTFIGYAYVWFAFSADTTSSSTVTEMYLSSAISKMIKYGATIVSIQQIPLKMWNNYITHGNSHSSVLIDTLEISPITHFVDPDGTTYTPKNKKMLSSPFVKIVVMNNEGNSSELDWELFLGSGPTKTATFYLHSAVFPSAEAMLIPHNYRGFNLDFSSASTCTNFIQNAWSEDSYSKWWNVNKQSYATSMATTAIRGIASMFGGSGSSGALSGETLALFKMKHLIDVKSQMRATPDTINGELSADSLRIAQNRIGFSVIQMAITADTAKTIDSYFSVYGYAVKSVKEPDILRPSAPHRPYWNYIKTNDAVALPILTYSIPQEDLTKISDIYNNGLTFWMNVNYVGNYAYDNSPT